MNQTNFFCGYGCSYLLHEQREGCNPTVIKRIHHVPEKFIGYWTG
jgi:hypothetical protein